MAKALLEFRNSYIICFLPFAKIINRGAKNMTLILLTRTIDTDNMSMCARTLRKPPLCWSFSTSSLIWENTPLRTLPLPSFPFTWNPTARWTRWKTPRVCADLQSVDGSHIAFLSSSPWETFYCLVEIKFKPKRGKAFRLDWREQSSQEDDTLNDSRAIKLTALTQL